VPAGVKSFALICDDPDAPMKEPYVHWVIYNIPAATTGLDEAIPTTSTLPSGAVQGKNSSGRTGYTGPNPPSGTHRYFFKLYGLDKKLDLAPGATKAELLRATEGHIVAQGQVMGTYKR
jgi:Raf kinase inhibitor-like YbhB/YbcL family protein